MEQEAAAGWADSAGAGHHLRRGGRGEGDHHRQRRPLPRPPRFLRRRRRLRRRPPQPGPPPRPREPRQLHGRRRPQRRVRPRPGPRPRQALAPLAPPLHLQASLQAPPRLWRQGPPLDRRLPQVPCRRRRRLRLPFPAHDFILIDCPAGIITAITPANEAVLVTTSDITALRDADRVTGLLECDGIKDIKMIVNRVRTDLIKGEDMMSVLDVQEMLGLALLGVIPEDSEVVRSTNRGYPLVRNKPPTLAGLAFEQAAWRLVGQDSMTAVVMDEEPKKRGLFSFFGG